MLARVILLAVAPCDLAFAQAPAMTELTIDITNLVEYRADISDVTKFARNPNVTPAIALGSSSMRPEFESTLVTVVAIRNAASWALHGPTDRRCDASNLPHQIRELVRR